MKEIILHEIWQQQTFIPYQLTTVCGLPLIIWDKGQWNRTDGPDFTSAVIQIANHKLQGNIEIHHKASDWYKHNHHKNPEYNSVILHVVLHADTPIKSQQGIEIHTLELRHRINTNLKSMALRGEVFLCAEHHKSIESWTDQLEIAYKQRLRLKVDSILYTHRNQLKNDWWFTTIWCILSSFLGHHNGKHALSFVQQWNKKVILTCSSPHQLIAYLLGTGGFIKSSNNRIKHGGQLSQEYFSVKFKYQLPEILPIPWDYKEVRPASFPEIRIAQFAIWLYKFRNKLDTLTATPINNTFISQLTNVDFLAEGIPALGKSKAKEIAINAIALIKLARNENSRFAYLDLKNEMALLSPENHRIIKKFNAHFPRCNNALESQQLLSQYNEFCSKRRCLQCQIGKELLCRTST